MLRPNGHASQPSPSSSPPQHSPGPPKLTLGPSQAHSPSQPRPGPSQPAHSAAPMTSPRKPSRVLAPLGSQKPNPSLQSGEIVHNINTRLRGGVGNAVLNGEPKKIRANRSTFWLTESLEGIPFGAFVFLATVRGHLRVLPFSFSVLRVHAQTILRPPSSGLDHDFQRFWLSRLFRPGQRARL